VTRPGSASRRPGRQRPGAGASTRGASTGGASTGGSAGTGGGAGTGGAGTGGGGPGGSSLSAADLARARAAAASLGPDFDNDDFDADGERDSLTDVPGGVRLQKVLAAAGVGSRRHCEELIGAGRVEVDGEIVRRFGARVDPQHQVIRVDGRRIPASEDLVYIALNKPAGVLTSMSDSRGRATMADLLGDVAERLFHVGRLDYDTEGLLLLTNDGELAHRLAHPRFGVPKTYLAEVTGPVPKDLGRQLITGIELEDGVASADKFRVVEQVGARALVEITLHEGRKHIVKRMLAAAGHPVTRLVRTQVGPVSLGSMRPGTTRSLTTREVGDLYSAVGL
jgi:23S rRNA pseudouridine2605 synthase